MLKLTVTICLPSRQYFKVYIALSTFVDSLGPHKNGVRQAAVVVSKARSWYVQDD